MRVFVVAAALALVGLVPAGYGQTKPEMPMPMPMPTPGAAGSPGEAGMMAAMDRMSNAMAAVPMTGNADRAFAQMMVPHHQGAIDMARFELAHGRDPAMRRLARSIVAAQEREMAQMRGWLAAHPGP